MWDERKDVTAFERVMGARDLGEVDRTPVIPQLTYVAAFFTNYTILKVRVWRGAIYRLCHVRRARSKSLLRSMWKGNVNIVW
jgi:hypothetical protein